MNLLYDNKKVKFGLLSLIVFPFSASASTLISLGSASLAGSTHSIAGSSITYTSTLIFGGTADADNHRVDAGAESGSVGTFGNYNDTIFGSSNLTGDASGTPANVITDGTYSTRIGVGPDGGAGGLDDVDDGLNTGFKDYIAIHVQFSTAVELSAFAVYDIDGDASKGQNEWSAAFAYNAITSMTVLPGITLGTAIDPLVQTGDDTVNWGGIAGAPSTYEVVYNNTTTGNLDALDQEGQVIYDFNNAEVTDLYILAGIAADRDALDTSTSGTSTLNGITGITIPVVPEPSSTLLIGLGCLATLSRRKR